MEKDKKSSSATSLNDLPLEILLEILHKLPVKELHRIKVVCKLWSSVISHLSFRSKYLVGRNSSLTLYLRFDLHCSNSTNGWSTQSPRVSLNFLPEIVMKKVCHNSSYALFSSNGLILWSNIYTCSFVVCNPVTKQWLTLPSPSNPGERVLSGFVSCESENGSTQFKVVRIARDPRIIIVSNVLNIEIFDSATNQWRQLTKTLDIKVAFRVNVSAVEIRGIFYWENESKELVIAFDSNHDTCFWFSLPGPSFPNRPFLFNRMLEKSGDHLYYVHLEFDAQNIPFTIWRYDEFEGKHTWSVHVSLDFDFFWNGQQTKLYTDECNLLAIDPMDCNIFYLSWQHKESDSYIHRIYSFDVARRKLDEICSFPEHMAVGCTLFVEPTWPTKI